MSPKFVSRKFLLASASAMVLIGADHVLAAQFGTPPAGTTQLGTSQVGTSQTSQVGTAPAGAAPAPAAGLPPPPPPVPVITWTGFYVGGQIGYVWGDNSGNGFYATPGGLIGTGPLVDDAQGVIGGAHVGYNLQMNNWVIGAEGTIEGTNLSKRVSIGIADPNSPTNPNTGSPLFSGTLGGIVQSNVQGSIRGRAGFAWDRLFIYGTGGVAFGGFSTDLNISVTDPTGSYYAGGMRSTTRVGWTAGGGVEYAINNNWSVRGECRYSDFGHLIDSPISGTAGLAFSTNRHLVQNQVDFGFSYKFDSFVPPPVVAKY